ncbi:phosphatase [Halolactibacillus alkaliphilus]|uniref:Phosphatase n=1 Tax=Halolactibacillus alkaliphilus TaxID=442899 RepID=A0A511X278_9BACI|nr:HAD hydrolase-like protein [Halolactibacillus alkaliphilus]GEN57040.1 phosphatase [Halolactibacillus alkaliphilus]GGN68556.1 phosphatase [Halolactibacillus alkaliphilus]SFO85839.1 Phosphoglycolate phosphatase, HAD superfamily [Halolactibacillus alkaliphilus]
MNTHLVDFHKKHNVLVCVDSDGCAMDTMDVKHIECFGPKIIEVFGLEKMKGEFLDLWNELNLYSMTRGINRFKGLVLSFDVAAERGMDVVPFKALKKWTEETSELSNRALAKSYEETGEEELALGLLWSEKVNEAIGKLSDVDKPFDGVKEGLALVSQEADVAIVSSANTKAVLEEWTRHGLDEYVDILLGQEAGSKAKCIDDLRDFNYRENQIVMVGDAPGDLDAAKKNGVHFYPIIVGQEEMSWNRLRQEAFPRLLSGAFDDAYQEKLIDEFHEALSSR